MTSSLISGKKSVMFHMTKKKRKDNTPTASEGTSNMSDLQQQIKSIENRCYADLIEACRYIIKFVFGCSVNLGF